MFEEIITALEKRKHALEGRRKDFKPEQQHIFDAPLEALGRSIERLNLRDDIIVAIEHIRSYQIEAFAAYKLALAREYISVLFAIENERNR